MCVQDEEGYQATRSNRMLKPMQIGATICEVIARAFIKHEAKKRDENMKLLNKIKELEVTDNDGDDG